MRPQQGSTQLICLPAFAGVAGANYHDRNRHALRHDHRYILDIIDIF